MGREVYAQCRLQMLAPGQRALGAESRLGCGLWLTGNEEPHFRAEVCLTGHAHSSPADLWHRSRGMSGAAQKSKSSWAWKTRRRAAEKRDLALRVPGVGGFHLIPYPGSKGAPQEVEE